MGVLFRLIAFVGSIHYGRIKMCIHFCIKRDTLRSRNHIKLEIKMTIERFHTNNRMSQIVIHNDTVYLAGQVALKAPGNSVAEQTKAILDQIDGLLTEAGTDKSKVLTATIWLCSMDDFEEMNIVWDQWSKGGAAPCRAAVESPRLAASQFTVEIGIIAAR